MRLALVNDLAVLQLTLPVSAKDIADHAWDVQDVEETNGAVGLGAFEVGIALDGEIDSADADCGGGFVGEEGGYGCDVGVVVCEPGARGCNAMFLVLVRR